MNNTPKPIDPAIRLAIATWPENAPRGAVTAFCTPHGISRKAFYAIRKRAETEGQAAALAPKSRKPHTSPTKINEETKDSAVRVRLALEQSGLDCGPISVYDKMTQMGMTPPSIASLARIFRERDQARAQPKKKPRSAYRRFVYPAPNACWQLDATSYILTEGRSCVIFQLQDDHSRLAIASLVATSENAQAAVAVFRKGIAAYGIPQRLLTDNGIALNPSRRGYLGQLTALATSLGVEPITGKPYKPTTQGKNERFHQTLFRWLDKQPLASSIDELQVLVDEFDVVYNTQRPHQALPGRMTPAQAWAATEVAQPPTPPEGSHIHPQVFKEPIVSPAVTVLGQSTNIHPQGQGWKVQRVYLAGTVSINGTLFYVPASHKGLDVQVVWDRSGIMIAGLEGEVLVEYDWPSVKARYVPKSQARWVRDV